MFGYSLIKTEDVERLELLRDRVADAQRWLSGFKDLDVIWDWLWKRFEYPFRTNEMRERYAKERESSVYGKLDAVREAIQLKADLETARGSVRYALATFRALDQYVYENSDHALLIKEAVSKLEDVGFLQPHPNEQKGGEPRGK
jgi:hypothetical protein